MAETYTVTLRITVYKGKPESIIVQEETSYPDITFSKMTRISSDYYDLLEKAKKEKD